MNHKEIERMVNKWKSFQLNANFTDEEGSSCIDLDEFLERRIFENPYSKTGKIYRWLCEIPDLGWNRYALVTEDGKITLSVKVGEYARQMGTQKKDLIDRYQRLKQFLDEANLQYLPDTKFEEHITKDLDNVFPYSI